MLHGQLAEVDGPAGPRLRVPISLGDHRMPQPLTLLAEPSQVLGSRA